MTTSTMKKKYSLLQHNTFRLKVRADYYFSYSNEEELLAGLPQVRSLDCPILMVGEGSNLLFMGDYKGVVIHSAISGCEIVDENGDDIIVRVGSGVVWDDFVAWAVAKGYGGVENLSAIPGAVGASPVQNVGAYGVEAKDVIYKVEAIALATGEKRFFSNADCEFEYRDSIFKNELKGKYIVTYVDFKLSKCPTIDVSYGNIKAMLNDREPSLSLLRKLITSVRNSKLPDYKKLGNAGSFFTNPYVAVDKYEALKQEFPDMPCYPIDDVTVKVPAGWLIDRAGLKGFQHKNAAVHEDQALVLINTGGATGAHILELAHIIIDKVNAMFGVELVPEVNILG